MPNWCSTSIVVRNQDADVIENLAKEFDNAFQCNKIANGFGDKWLGNILSYLGYSEDEVLNGTIRCRGEIVWIESHGNELFIDTDTAWTPMLQVIVKMVEKYAPDSDITYRAVEPGCGIFSTNELDLAGAVYIDVFENLPKPLAWIEEENYDHMDMKQFVKEVAESMGWSESEAEEKIDDELSELFSCNVWKYTEIDEW